MSQPSIRTAFPPVCICVRRTLDWSDEAAVNAGLKPDFKAKFDAWNAHFNLSYPRFRQRLKEIAELNLRQVRDAVIVTPETVPPGSLVVPVDDDDWFAPDLVDHLRAAWDPAFPGIVWTPFILEAPHNPPPFSWFRPFFPKRPLKYTCISNNHAFVYAGPWAGLIVAHGKASHFFDRHRPQVRFLTRYLSIQNTNLSSQTVLNWNRPTITPAKLTRVFRRHRSLYRRPRLPAELAWALPYVKQMAELTNELKLA
jgi:hypothetical protein